MAGDMSIQEEANILPSIQSLAFMQVRLPLLDVSHNPDLHDKKRAQDRTTTVIKRWTALVSERQAARLKTLHYCEARPGKGDTAVLAIVDREKFDALHTFIAALSEQITTFEEAIRKLDAIGGNLWLYDVENQALSASLSEDRMKKRIAQLTAEHTLKNQRMSIEEVLKLPEYQKNLPMFEREIANSKATLAKTKPILDEMEAILESVGC